jgi:cytochrome c oxidase subunit 3
MTLALPPAPTPPRARMLFVGTALTCVAGFMLMMSMVATYLFFRDAAGGTTASWLPAKVGIPEIAANVMIVTLVGASVMVQWAVYAIERDDRRNCTVALVITVIFGVAVVNAQAYIYGQMGMGIADGTYELLFYTLTGAFLAALFGGIAFAAVTAFRELGGRYSSRRHEGISALALYWHFLTAVFAVVWFVLYVTK